MRPRLRILLFLVFWPTAIWAQENSLSDLEALATAAQQGNVAAQAELGQRYHLGLGTVQNFARAAEWFGQAAKAGNPLAQNQLGKYYHSGLGVAADRQTALHWLEAAASTGEPAFLYDLATVLEEDKEDDQGLLRAAELYQRAATAGHVEAAVNLGVMYQNGLGVGQDFLRAKALYEAPAAAGHPKAQNNLGLLYVRGDGVPKDYNRAAALFAAAAKSGLPQAYSNLGVMYENGFGVPQSDTEAANLYKLGAAGTAQAQNDFVYDPRLLPPPEDAVGLATLRAMALAGEPIAQFQLGWLLVHQTDPNSQMWFEAARLFAAAAEKGHSASMANLGILYERGKGLPQDFVLAQMWLTLAGSNGLNEVIPLIAQLQRKMLPQQINEAQSLAEAKRQATISQPSLP